MNRKNNKKMLKLYSLVLATSLIFSSCKEDASKYNMHEYPWTGGVLDEDELVHKRKGEKATTYIKRR